MVEVSYDDFKKYEETKKLPYLRDAANKLVGATENIVSTYAQVPIENWGDFRANFSKVFKNHEIFVWLTALHKFFYEGMGYDGSVEDIKYIYSKARKELRSFLSQERKKKLVAV